MAKCTNSLEKKQKYLIIFLGIILVSSWETSDPCSPHIPNIMICCHGEYEQYIRFLWSCFSTGAFSPYHVECCLWNDPQKMWNVWAVRNDAVAKCAESCQCQKGEILSILSLLFSCETMWHLHTLVLSSYLKQVCRSDGHDQNQIFVWFAFMPHLIKVVWFLFSIFVPSCRKRMSGYACICSKELMSCKLCLQ